jgi:hypothetical protein
MKHIALFASVLAAFLLPTGAFANDKQKDFLKFQAQLAQINADRAAIAYARDERPIPCQVDDRCAPRHYYYQRHDHDYYRGYR